MHLWPPSQVSWELSLICHQNLSALLECSDSSDPGAKGPPGPGSLPHPTPPHSASRINSLLCLPPRSLPKALLAAPLCSPCSFCCHLCFCLAHTQTSREGTDEATGHRPRSNLLLDRWPHQAASWVRSPSLLQSAVSRAAGLPGMNQGSGSWTVP